MYARIMVWAVSLVLGFAGLVQAQDTPSEPPEQAQATEVSGIESQPSEAEASTPTADISPSRRTEASPLPPPPEVALTPELAAIDLPGFRRNRRVSIAGRVLTAVGPVVTLAGLLMLPSSGELFDARSALVVFAGTGTGFLGRLMWTGADMRLTKRLRAAGVPVRRGAAIAALVLASISWVPYAAVPATAGTWIAGAVASSRLPGLHAHVGELASATALPRSGVGELGARFALRF